MLTPGTYTLTQTVKNVYKAALTPHYHNDRGRRWELRGTFKAGMRFQVVLNVASGLPRLSTVLLYRGGHVGAEHVLFQLLAPYLAPTFVSEVV